MLTSIASMLVVGAVLSPSAQISQIASARQANAPNAPSAPNAPIAPIAPIAPDSVVAMQFPLPPVPPVPPRDPNEKPRERDRRRVPNGWVETTEPFSRTFPVGKGATLILSNTSGTVQVTAASGDRIDVDALKHAWGPNAEQAKRRLADAQIESYASGNRVELRVEHGDRGGDRRVDIEFNVKVPADTAVDIRTASGDVRVTNVKGEVRVQSANGHLALEGTTRLAAVKTVSGSITIANGGADAQLSLSTINGDLLVQLPTSERSTATSIFTPAS
jgi:hypothetical protein